MEDDFFAMPQLTPPALSRPQQSLTPHGLGCLNFVVSVCGGSSFLCFSSLALWKWEAAVSPADRKWDCVLLPLLTTNSLPGSGQFPLCCYNLFGFQVPHQIKNNLLGSPAQWCWHPDRDAPSPCASERHPVWWGAILLGGKGFVMGDGRWRLEDMSGHGSDLASSLIPFKKYSANRYWAPMMCYILYQGGGVHCWTDRICALIWVAERHTIGTSTDKWSYQIIIRGEKKK